MTEEKVPYTTDGHRPGDDAIGEPQKATQDEELTLAIAALHRLHAALETLRSSSEPHEKAIALQDGRASSGVLQAILSDWLDELGVHEEHVRQRE